MILKIDFYSILINKLNAIQISLIYYIQKNHINSIFPAFLIQLNDYF